MCYNYFDYFGTKTQPQKQRGEMSMYNIEGLRAVALYRVSTDKQTSGDDKDIPAQRELVREFIDREGLKLVREFVEGGVSGFKTKVDERDALVTIKQLAQEKLFDVLVVYKSDRIGRTTDESPLVISYLNKYGIRVFATDIGEIKTTTQVDKLMTFLTFWQNETESVKMSERSTDYHILLIKNGRFRGGGDKAIPYGYKTVDKGNVNHKGRRILDLVIDEEQAEIVKLIYQLSIENNMGSRAIASYLNENGFKDKAKNPTGWSYRTVMNILNNMTYKGYLHMYSKLRNELYISPKLEHLVIIPEEIWDLNQQIMKNRATKGETKSNNTRGATYGKALFSGLVYCGHCGSKMHLWANHKSYTRKDGTKHKFVKVSYKCMSRLSRGRIQCSGQATYSVNRIDNLAESIMLDYLDEISQKELREDFVEDIKHEINTLTKKRKELENKLDEVQTEIKTLVRSIAKSIQGDKSVLPPELLNEAINQCKEDEAKLLKELTNLDETIFNKKNYLTQISKVKTNLCSIKEKYEKATWLEKKAIINNYISRVEIQKVDDKNIQITLDFNIILEDFKNNTNESLVVNCINSLYRNVPITLPKNIVLKVRKKMIFSIAS